MMPSRTWRNGRRGRPRFEILGQWPSSTGAATVQSSSGMVQIVLLCGVGRRGHTRGFGPSFRLPSISLVVSSRASAAARPPASSQSRRLPRGPSARRGRRSVAATCSRLVRSVSVACATTARQVSSQTPAFVSSWKCLNAVVPAWPTFFHPSPVPSFVRIRPRMVSPPVRLRPPAPPVAARAGGGKTGAQRGATAAQRAALGCRMT